MATSYYHVDASSLIDDAIENSADTSAQGRRFEHISMYFLENDPQWGDVFDEVWLWEDAPTNNGKHDTGIDLVAHDAYEDTYWAIQCKAWRGPLSEGDLATFFANAFAPGAPYGHALLMDTASKLSSNLEQYMLENQVTRIDRNDIEQANIDWSTYTGGKPTGRKTFDPRPHQREAIDGCLDAFQSADRCRLIMACGTGKTLTSKRLQEELCPDGLVLYLAPSIALVGQNMRDWVNQTRTPIRTFVVCSDPTASKLPKGEDADVTSTLLDVPFPASTDAGTLASRLKKHRKSGETTVVFSTYQSIEAIHEAQELGIGDFDLVICDEAHRTTGVKTGGLDDSAFVRIHDNEYISAKKRLYMTATPRVFGDAAKAKAGQEGFPIASMDDEETYGPIGYRLSFGQAVERGLLSDYRIVVMTVTEDSMSETMQKLIAGSDGQIDVDDAARIAGTWKAMVEPRRAQRLSGADIDLDDGESGVDTDDRILRRVIGFAGRIRDSKGIRDEWNAVIEAYARDHADESNVSAFTGEVRHVDGTQSSAERKESLNWLRDAPDDGTECRILTNARCLSEGIDVPSLDAVVYFATRKSKVDVIQSVGRVMRKSPGKEYGYIIIPIFVPTGVDPRMALSASEVYAPVWDILQALRSHDERLNAKINAMYLGDKDALAGVIEVDVLDEDKVEAQIAAQRKKSQKEAGKHRKTNVKAPEHSEKKDETDTAAVQMTLDLYQGIKDGIVAEVVRHCGTRGYWKIWANDVGKIARKRTEQVADLIEQDAVAAKAFDGFLDGLRDTLNPGVSQQEAIEIIAQQEITQPIFELLFDDPEVVRNNPVAKGMTGTIEALHEAGLPNSMRDPVLRDVYDSVALSVKQIHDDTARQKLVRELYNDFFANAFKKTSEKMGIVYTPEQIVDAQLYIVQRALRREFGVELGTPGVHVLDPFAGTGTYMSRLIADQNLISDDELEYKFLNDLHSNEILPMAATIMSINIEQAYHGRVGGDYVQFPGALLTDTFQMDEWGDTIDDSVFTENTERIEKQRKTDVHVIIGNPPYSSGQKNADDSAQNEPYPTLDKNIHDTYAANSINGSKKMALYDSYIRSFRWASDRIGSHGVVCFVTNAGWVDGAAMDGFRRCLTEEFSDIYVFHFKGNQRTLGEESRRQGGKIFGSGSRAPIAITMLIKNPESKDHGRVFMHFVDDYLTREEKLSIAALAILKDPDWKEIHPNRHEDWVNQRDDSWYQFMPMGLEKMKPPFGAFTIWSSGVITHRDTWMYSFSKRELKNRIGNLALFFNKQWDIHHGDNPATIEKVVTKDPKQIKWDKKLYDRISKGEKILPDQRLLVTSSYRPYCTQYLYFDRDINWSHYQLQRLFPISGIANRYIAITNGTNPSALISDRIPDLHFVGDSQCFPLYWYESTGGEGGLFDANDEGHTAGYVRHDSITDETLIQFQNTYPHCYSTSGYHGGPRAKKDGGPEITKGDIFYYIYGILHSPEYRNRFVTNLQKELPRIPLVKDFRVFEAAGRRLADLHIHYEDVKTWGGLTESGSAANRNPAPVVKMRWAKKSVVDEETGKTKKIDDKTRLIYGPDLTIEGIPETAQEYVINGRSALDWVIRQYQVTTDKASGIVNDPNEWEPDNPRYIVDLFEKLVTVSVETVNIVGGLPPLHELDQPVDWPSAWRASE